MKKFKEMNNCWWINGFLRWNLLVFIWIFYLNSIFCLALNNEGNALLKFKERVVNDPFKALSSWVEENGEANPCSWFGVGCAGGHVVSLNLKNLCLEGTLAPELQQLLHIKSITLRNNSFFGFIPDEFRNLKELQLLDLGDNNFDAFPSEFEWNIPNFLLDNTEQSICHTSAKMEEHMMLSEIQDNDHFADFLPYTWSRHTDWEENDRHPRSLQQGASNEKENNERTSTDSSTIPKVNPLSSSPKHSPPPFSPPSRPPRLPPLSPPVPPAQNGIQFPGPPPHSSAGNGNKTGVIGGVVGGAICLVLVIGLLLLYLFKSKKIRTAGPWATGLSGQLQKAFVAGIPNLKRSELESACEDFSNVIGSSSLGTIYKGTLSNGVEIAVITLSVTFVEDWSKNMEAQFRKKIEALSKVNHKNFVNLIGYCGEEDPFTRFMVFEYAPNGSLFEHLHVREAEHLDWGMRLRVAMGISYCLEHMHQLTPPVIHPNLNSSAVSLSDDYAAKISEFCFWNEVAALQVKPMVTNSLITPSVTPESNVLTFGLVLLEMMTGRIPHSMDNNSFDDWVLEYMRGELPLQEIVDPMLRYFDSEQLYKIGEVIRKCLHSEQYRPTMKDVTTKLREVTGINQDKAAPRFSSLWWAELETRSANGA